MSDVFASLTRSALLALPPEPAHRAAILGLRAISQWPGAPLQDDPKLATSAFGLSFTNPLGMAAGFDKNAEVPDALLKLGFGFTEIGTVTPLPQPGNAQPRMFRLPDDLGIINRLGFNNQGHAAALERLKTRPNSGIVGVNLGANKDASDRVADYVSGIRTFHAVASYFTVNVSSPNTPGLRDLQGAAALNELLARVLEARDSFGRGSISSNAFGKVPVLLKIAPDLTLENLDDIVSIARKRCIDGMIVSNTTVSRPQGLRGPVDESGGLSGRPLFELSTKVLAEVFLRAERQFPLIGVGGIHDGATAYAKIKAGADLLQLYSAFVFKGLGLLKESKSGLVSGLAHDGFTSLAEAVGTSARQISEGG